MSPLKVNYGIGGDSDDTYGLDHAHRLVKSILHQITEGDAPSGNFENFDNNRNIGGNVTQSQRFHVKLPSSGTTTTTNTTRSNQSGFATFSDYQSSQSDCNDATSACTASEPSILSSSL